MCCTEYSPASPDLLTSRADRCMNVNLGWTFGNWRSPSLFARPFLVVVLASIHADDASDAKGDSQGCRRGKKIWSLYNARLYKCIRVNHDQRRRR